MLTAERRSRSDIRSGQSFEARAAQEVTREDNDEFSPKTLGFVPSTEKRQTMSKSIMREKETAFSLWEGSCPDLVHTGGTVHGDRRQFFPMSREHPSPIRDLTHTVEPTFIQGSGNYVTTAPTRETEGRRSVAFRLPENRTNDGHSTDIQTPLRNMSPLIPVIVVKQPGRHDNVEPIPFKLRHEIKSGTATSSKVFTASSNQSVHLQPEASVGKSGRASTFRDLEDVVSEFESQRRQAEETRRRYEVMSEEMERLKRNIRSNEDSSQRSSNGSNESKEWVTDLMSLLFSQKDHKETRTMVDSTLESLRNKTQDAEAWFLSFERVAKASGWSEKVKGEMLRVKLKDYALRQWEALDPSLQYDYEACRKYLIAKLNKSESHSERISIFFERSQRVDESVEDFARELTKLALKAFPDMEVEARRGVVAQRFGQGLNRKIKEKLAFQNFNKWAESVDDAKRVEKFLRD